MKEDMDAIFVRIKADIKKDWQKVLIDINMNQQDSIEDMMVEWTNKMKNLDKKSKV